MTRSVTLAASAVLVLAVGGCVGAPQQPTVDFGLDEAFVRMDEAVAQTITGLPEFPGFDSRTTLQLDCAVEGRESYEISYAFAEESVGTELVTEAYFAVLEDHWTSLGWEVHGQRDDGAGGLIAIQGLRPDGVNVWYANVLGAGVLHSQVSCVEAEGTPVCGAPLGGVTPANDSTKDCILHEG